MKYTEHHLYVEIEVHWCRTVQLEDASFCLEQSVRGVRKVIQCFVCVCTLVRAYGMLCPYLWSFV